MMTINLQLVVSLLLAVTVLAHPTPSKNPRFLDKEILSQDEIERTVRRIEEGDDDETAELIDIEEEHEEDRKVLTVKSHKRQMRLDLKPAYGLIKPDIRVVVMDNDGERETDLPASLRFGLYRGSVTGSHKGVAALMKNEEGWNGLVTAEGQHYHLHGLKRTSRSLLVPFSAESKDDIPKADFLESTEEKEVENMAEDGIFTRDLSSELKLEVGVTTDPDVYLSAQKRYPNSDPETKVKEMILNAVNTIQAYFTASDLDYKINFQLSAMHILKEMPKEILEAGSSYFAYRFFNQWDENHNNPGQANYDMGLFFSASPENGAGVAPVSKTCRGKSSAAYSKLTSYAGAVLMTHEIGHNMGAPHDNDEEGSENNCGLGYIMWPVINRGANSFSPCSKRKMSAYIKKLDEQGKNCMRTDAASPMKVCPSTLLPGRTLQPNEQCHLTNGEGFVDKVTSDNFCKTLGCKKHFFSAYPYMGAPLPGTSCGLLGETKMCWQDECLDHAVVYEKIKELYKGRGKGTSTCPFPDMVPPPITPNPCGVGWDKYGDFCYQLISKEQTRDEGAEACKALGDGSSLASIHSQKENDFTHRYKTFFIGLKDHSYTSLEGQDVERDWKWDDGSPFEFTTWGKDEPNNDGGSEKCVKVQGGFYWRDIECDTKLPSLCKKPIVPPAPPASTPPPENPCGEGWKGYRDYCYKMITQPGTGQEGEAACKALGGGSHLTSILDREEGDFIRAVFQKKREELFIGLEDKSYTTLEGDEVEREWKWTDGSPYGYTAWATRNPNNLGGSEKCVLLTERHNWNDISCGNKFPSLCKRPLVAPAPPASTPPPVNPCGEGWKEYKDYCYQMITKPGEGKEGEMACRKLGGGSHLTSILSRDEADFIKVVFQSKGEKIYIGLQDKSHTTEQGPEAQRDWTWTDGSPYEYSKWAGKEPNNYGGAQRCVYLNSANNWIDISCNKDYPYLCKKPVVPPASTPPPAPECGLGWEEYGESCYQMLKDKGTEKEGEAACKALGGGSELASILSKDEAELVGVLFKSTFFIGLKDASYTSLEGTDAKRDWKWADGSLYEYTAWSNKEPNNMGGSEKCVQASGGIKWVDISCKKKLRSLCKKPLVPLPPTSTPPPENPCGEGWKEYGNYCYQMTTKKETGQKGRVACKALGGGSHLTSVLNRDEADFIRAVFQPNREEIYIGLVDKSYTTEQGTGAKRDWQWTDGSLFGYTAWSTGEPNNAQGSQRCVYINGKYKWTDIACSKSLPSLCKRPVVPPAITPPPVPLCGQGWVEYRHYCYQMTNVMGTQKEGEAACKKLGEGSELASILNRDESDFVAAIFKSSKRFFIGLKDGSSTSKQGTGVKREWEWSDGSLYEYKRWNKKEPNNWKGQEKCTIVVARYKWNDYSCDKKLPSLCKKPGGS